jgi:transcriptional regulator with XRE-family HTH domain
MDEAIPGVALEASSRSAAARDEFRYKLGQNIRRQRRARGLSQERLSEMAGLHRGTVYVIEIGHREPRAETIARLSAAMGCEPCRFYDGIQWIPGPPAASGTFRFDSPPGRPRKGTSHA